MTAPWSSSGTTSTAPRGTPSRSRSSTPEVPGPARASSPGGRLSLVQQPRLDARDVRGGVGAGEVGAAGAERVEDAAVLGEGALDGGVVGQAAPHPGSCGG